MGREGLTAVVIGAAIEVQRTLGPGLLESAYAGALAHELGLRDVRFRREVAIPAVYKGALVGHGFRADFILEDRLIVELKTVDTVLQVHRAQLLSYLRLSGHALGLLINFHATPLVRGIHRVVNTR